MTQFIIKSSLVVLKSYLNLFKYVTNDFIIKLYLNFDSSVLKSHYFHLSVVENLLDVIKKENNCHIISCVLPGAGRPPCAYFACCEIP